MCGFGETIFIVTFLLILVSNSRIYSGFGLCNKLKIYCHFDWTNERYNLTWLVL